MALTNAGVQELTRRPVFVRWIGFTGSVMLGIAAFVGGAFPALDPDATALTIAEGPNGALIYLLWALGTALLIGAWWLGRHLVGTGSLTPRWVVVTAALWMLPMVVCPPTGSRDVYAYACQGALVAAGHSPYYEGVSALPCQWLDSVSVIWRNTPAPYGPLFLVIAGAVAKMGSLTAVIVFFRLLSIAGVAMIAMCMPMIARRVGTPVDRALWLILACPLVIVHLVGGAHNDAFTVGLLVAGLALLATRSHRAGALILGGVLFGLSIAIKPTIGAMLPFGVLLAAGGNGVPANRVPAIGVLVRRGIAVIGAALVTLLALSWGSGFGTFGWISALSHAGVPEVWTSPPSAVGLSIDYVGRAFGADLHAGPACRLAALVLMPIALLLILWRSRDRDPLYGGGLALLTTIFLAPVVQAWYLVWPLAMFAAATVRIRWFVLAIAFLSCTILPDGNGFTRPLQPVMSFVVTGVVIWVIVRGVSWLRGSEPSEIEFAAPARAGSDRRMADAVEHAVAGLAPTSPAISGAQVAERGRSTLPPDI